MFTSKGMGKAFCAFSAQDETKADALAEFAAVVLLARV